MISIFLSILFSTSVLAAPTLSESTIRPWSNYKNDKSLARFHNTLLNETLLAFLNECYSPNVTTTKVTIPCALYFDAVLQLNNTNFVVPLPSIITLANESSKDKEFCKQKHTYPAAKNFRIPLEDFNDPSTCTYMCMQHNAARDSVPKPICSFLVWMGDQIKNLNHTAVPAVQPPPLASVPVAKGNISHAAPNKELVKPPVADAAEKPELPHKAANTQSNISAQASTKKVDPPVQIIPKSKQDSVERKENSVVAAAPPAVAAAAPEAGALPAVKLEKQLIAPAKEDQEDSPPTLSPETQKEETLIPTKQGKYDSLPIDQQLNIDQPKENDSDPDTNPNEYINPEDGEDDNDDIEIRDEKPKLIETPLASPEQNEVSPKGTKKITDSNNLQSTNHVTDPFLEESGSNFFTYFLIGMFLCILLYVVYHNKSKILALLLEGRRSDKGRSGRRKHTAAYRKLDSNLEEAITSSASGRTTQIIY